MSQKLTVHELNTHTHAEKTFFYLCHFASRDHWSFLNIFLRIDTFLVSYAEEFFKIITVISVTYVLTGPCVVAALSSSGGGSSSYSGVAISSRPVMPL